MRYVFALFACLWCAPFSQVFAETLEIRADLWCPFNCEPLEPKPGYAIEILQKIFEPKGISIHYDVTNWTRAIERTRGGHFDAIVGALKSDAPDFVFPKKELGVQKTGIYVSKDDSWRYKDLESLKKLKRIAIVKSYAYGQGVDEFINDPKNQDLFTKGMGNEALAGNMKLLKTGAVQALIEDINVFQMRAKQLDEAKYYTLAGILTEAKIYIAFAPNKPKSKEYAAIFDAGLEEITKSGELAKILSNYSLKN